MWSPFLKKHFKFKKRFVDNRESFYIRIKQFLLHNIYSVQYMQSFSMIFGKSYDFFLNSYLKLLKRGRNYLLFFGL